MIASLLLTLKLAFWTAFWLLLLAAPLAWWLARRSFRGKGLLESLLLLPLVLPPTVLGFYLLLFLGPSGPLVQGLGLRWAFTFEGILLGSVLFNLPLALSSYQGAFRAIDQDVLQTARTLGASKWRILREIILPLAAPGLISGTLLAFAHTLGEFGVVLMIGGSLPGQTQVLSIYLFELTQALRFAEAGQVALLLLGLALVLIYTIRHLEPQWKSNTR
jgi:molybdate transport system permease protein